MQISNFKFQISNYLGHPLLAGSLVMVIGNNLFNFGQFVYHFLVIRLLSTAHYGDLAAIISILSIIGIIQLSLGLTIVKFVATQKTRASTSNLVKWFNYWALLLGTGMAFLILMSSTFLANFLNLTQSAVLFLLAPVFLFFVVVYIHRSILQGLLSFKIYVTSFIVDVVVKIISTVGLVILGWALFGAMVGILLGILSAFLVTRISLSPYLLGRRGKIPEILPLLKYSFPVFVQGLAFTSMYSTDILLVKHFFSPDQAGVYAYLSVLGRIALYGSTPVTQTMFPIIARRFHQGQHYHRIFYLSALLVMTISLFVVLLFKLMPEIPISLLGKSEGQEILWWFGLFMTLLGVALLFIQFYLSINDVRPVWFFVLAALLQVILIWFIHPTLLSVIQISILSTALLTLALLVYFPYHRR